MDNMHYSLFVQLCKWSVIYGLACCVLSDTYWAFSLYYSYKVIGLVAIYVLRDSVHIENYMRNYTMGTGVQVSIGGHVKALALTLTVIHYSQYLKPVTVVDVRMCLGAILVLYGAIYLVNNLLSSQKDFRLLELERELLNGHIHPDVASIKLSDIMFGRAPAQVLQAEYDSFLNSIVIPEENDGLPKRITSYMNANIALKPFLRKLKNSAKMDQEATRVTKKKLYRIMAELRWKTRLLYKWKS